MIKQDSKPALAEVIEQVWSELGRGAGEARHPFHTPALATTEMGVPAVRTVVLRAADAETGSLACHTDLRSPKVPQLLANPEVAWLFYDREQKVQLRLAGEASLHHRDALANSRWERSRPRSRACYRQDLAPGAPADSEPCTPWQAEQGFANFAVVKCSIREIDWLYLRAGGHLRARFTRHADHAWRGEWIAP